jgi:cation diffusion facilitator family transporter
VVNTEISSAERDRKRLGYMAIYVGLAANIFLATIKTTIGILGGSAALLADGINSVSDVAYYLVVTVFVRMAGKPADDEHPYGHNQLESIAALVVGAFVITTAVTIFWESVNEVYEQLTGQAHVTGAAQITLYIALLTVLIKIGLMVYTRKIGQQTKNPVIVALAYDHRNDIFTALAASIGISFGLIGYTWVDPLAGALVALVILRTGVNILRQSTGELMDTVPGSELDRQVRQTLSGFQNLIEIEEVHAHRFGPYFVMNMTVGVEENLTVREGDQIASKIETILIDQIPNLRRVHVHYHPYKKI